MYVNNITESVALALDLYSKDLDSNLTQDIGYAELFPGFAQPFRPNTTVVSFLILYHSPYTNDQILLCYTGQILRVSQNKPLDSNFKSVTRNIHRNVA
jgi:hypothetical protein